VFAGTFFFEAFISRFNGNIALAEGFRQLRTAVFKHFFGVVDGGNAAPELFGDFVGGASETVVFLSFRQDKDGYHVVDFKTDSIETPGIHVAQMACYFQAVRSLYALPEKKECRVWLYYLRTGHAVEMTERVSKFNIEHRAFT
jgi:hypothetical protein